MFETDLFDPQYPTIEPAAKRDRILIVAPHMDDEAIGAGGFAVDAIANGAEVHVAFLTAGDCARFSARLLNRTIDPGPSDFLSVGRTRIREAADAMRILGVPSGHHYVLGYPDRGLRTMLDNPSRVVRSEATGLDYVPYDDALTPGARYTRENVIADMSQVIELAQPTTIIAPVHFDSHSDHGAAAEIVDLAVEEAAITPSRLGYLVHTSRFTKSLIWSPEKAIVPPARMRSYSWATYGVSEEGQRVKLAMLEAYRSQRPYTYLLRNTFVRCNELFFAPAPARIELARTAPSFACAPYSSASSL